MSDSALGRGCIAVAFAAATSAALSIASAVADAVAWSGAGFDLQVIAAAGGTGVLAGALCLGAVVAALAAMRLGVRDAHTVLSLRCTAVVAVSALALAVAGAWSYLAIHFSVPTNINEPLAVTIDGPSDYPLGFRLAGLSRSLAAVAVLLPTLWLAWPHLRADGSREADDDGHGASPLST